MTRRFCHKTNAQLTKSIIDCEFRLLTCADLWFYPVSEPDRFPCPGRTPRLHHREPVPGDRPAQRLASGPSLPSWPAPVPDLEAPTRHRLPLQGAPRAQCPKPRPRSSSLAQAAPSPAWPGPAPQAGPAAAPLRLAAPPDPGNCSWQVAILRFPRRSRNGNPPRPRPATPPHPPPALPHPRHPPRPGPSPIPANPAQADRFATA